MTLEELEVFIPTHRVPANFNDLTGWENDYFKVISRAPNKGKTVQWNCLCKSCNTYCIKNSSNLRRDKSCGCTKGKSIGEARVKNIIGQKFGLLTVVEDSGKRNKSRNVIWKCKCECGNFCEVDSNNLHNNHTLSCGCIYGSIGVSNIEQILKDNNITFVKEYPIKELYDKDPSKPFRFDFAVLENGNPVRFIEYDGIQHFKQTWGAWKTSISLATQQKRDREKNQFALNKQIPLVRIPYTERDNITLNMIMGDQYLVNEA